MAHQVEQVERNTGKAPVSDNLDAVRNYSLTDLKSAMAKNESTDPHVGMAASILDASPGFKNERDQQTMRDLHHALMAGDTQAFASAIGQFKNDPNRLQQFMNVLNQNLTDSGSGMNVSVNKGGDRVTIAGMSENAVQISVDGRASVRQVTAHNGGSFEYGAQVYDASPTGTMRAIAAGSRLNVIFNSFIKP